MTPTPYPLALNNSDQDVDIIGDPNGIHDITLAFDYQPSAGTVVVKYLTPWSTNFVTLSHANGASLTNGPIKLRIDGTVSLIRVTFSGLVGGVGARLWVDTKDYPIGLFSGNAAMVTQPYTETNVKRGAQFYARAVWPTSTRF